MDKNTKKIINNNDKNTEMTREELKVNSKAEKEVPEKSSENFNSNAFHKF